LSGFSEFKLVFIPLIFNTFQLGFLILNCNITINGFAFPARSTFFNFETLLIAATIILTKMYEYTGNNAFFKQQYLEPLTAFCYGAPKLY